MPITFNDRDWTILDEQIRNLSRAGAGHRDRGWLREKPDHRSSPQELFKIVQPIYVY
jgi:hypothetical protein